MWSCCCRLSSLALACPAPQTTHTPYLPQAGELDASSRNTPASAASYMALRLTGWLEDTFTTELLLGNSWLQQKNAAKEQNLAPEPRRKWAGLYRDDGSSLDIINHIHPERNSCLQLLQARLSRSTNSPLALTDGHSEVAAQFTPQCLRDLRARYPHRDFPHAASLPPAILVRKYAIRHTSYGPPRHHLCLILHAVDWVGGNHTVAYNRARLSPIHLSETVGAVLEQLHHTRAREDRRCLRTGEEPEHEEMPRTADGSDGASAGDATLHTQFAYGTQVTHPVRSRAVDGEPQVLGVNRMEPVLAGNTQRKELRPKAPISEYEKQMKLLSLLGQAAPTSAHGASNNKQQGESAQLIAEQSTRPLATSHQPRAPPETVLGKRRPTAASPEPVRGKKRMRDPERVSPEAADAETQHKQTDLDQMDALASACSWMTGFKLTRATSKVPDDQEYILQKEESWRKPQPGNRFPDHNIPSKTWQFLWRLADETAAVNTGADSESEIDPSPDSIIETLDPSPDSILQVTQQEIPTSQVSWSASPSPEPQPVRPARSFQDLPPDSSFEDVVTPKIDNVVQHEKLSSQGSQRPIVMTSSNEKEPSVPSSSPPVAEAFNDHDDAMDVDMEMEISVPQGLGEDVMDQPHTRQVEAQALKPKSPRSRSIVLVKETPYVKRRDGHVAMHTDSPSVQKAKANSTWRDPSSTSIVFGTYNQPKTLGSAGEDRRDKLSAVDTEIKQTSTGGPRIKIEQQAHEIRVKQMDHNAAKPMLSLNMTKDRKSSLSAPGQQDGAHQAQTVRKEVMSKETHDLPPESTPISAQVPLPDLSSSSGQVVSSLEKESEPPPRIKVSSPKRTAPAPESAKRKLDHSPSKRSSRHLKRREIKIVGFGDDAPLSIDTAAALRKEREESLSRFRAERKSSVGVVHRPGSANKAPVQRDDVSMAGNSPDVSPSTANARAMSPRHLGLYEDPSPIVRPVKDPAPSEPASNSFDNLDLSKTEGTISSQEQTDNLPAHGAEPDSNLSISLKPEKQRIQHERKSSLPAIEVQSSPTVKSPPTQDLKPRSIFQSFKAAYPEYTGDIKHFAEQCTQMYTLDLKDRMVPKWQWDDFIIRSLTDFKDYAIARLMGGQVVGEYIHFYKDNIRNTTFQKDIITNRNTLIKAIEELGHQPPAPEHPAAPTQPPAPTRPIQQPQPQPKPSPLPHKPSRASLPSPARAHKAPTKSRTNGTRPRHSLPAPSSHNPRVPITPLPTRSTPRTNLLARLATDATPATRTHGTPDPARSNGDAYREFVEGWTRMTAFTGSCDVDSKAAWPKNLFVRRSVGERLREYGRGEDDVLSWGDEL
ncbi:hypothetical protein P153DRAFT_394208 [Dothidotthia symphoricarpi CBS 119687]|uniref:Telomere replication protein EST3 n=1 Tax=Dothidotthia symphoricarpi CBS 119687 TaxID=1392245 RepID=A0A6A6AJB1_9PLEO|nr:uncharacterized protein P153DRAFT_394208 [Dothidotthia symphoricarpi CBS 119687]KAF2132029.1 hypothetical protein P153DRAFT_394208 [Dothidotthia symphoricarpi CBS 119687]